MGKEKKPSPLDAFLEEVEQGAAEMVQGIKRAGQRLRSQVELGWLQAERSEILSEIGERAAELHRRGELDHVELQGLWNSLSAVERKIDDKQTELQSLRAASGEVEAEPETEVIEAKAEEVEAEPQGRRLELDRERAEDDEDLSDADVPEPEWEARAGEAIEDDLLVCPECGAPFEKDARFCVQCGARL